MKWIAGLLMGMMVCGMSYAEVEVKQVEYSAGGVDFRGVAAVDTSKAGKLPGVLIIPEYWGMNDYVTSRAKQLAGLGYVAFVADMYGDGKLAKDAQEAGRLSGEVKGDRNLMRLRAGAGLEQLKAQEKVDADKIVAIGYCFGGTGVLELARSNADVLGVVSFHGGLERGDAATSPVIRPKVLVLHGAVDPHVSPESVIDFSKEMESSGADWYLVAYGGAVHAFTNPGAGDDPSGGAAYDKTADERSWRAMLDFFEEVF